MAGNMGKLSAADLVSEFFSAPSVPHNQYRQLNNVKNEPISISGLRANDFTPASFRTNGTQPVQNQRTQFTSQYQNENNVNHGKYVNVDPSQELAKLENQMKQMQQQITNLSSQWQNYPNNAQSTPMTPMVPNNMKLNNFETPAANYSKITNVENTNVGPLHYEHRDSVAPTSTLSPRIYKNLTSLESAAEDAVQNGKLREQLFILEQKLTEKSLHVESLNQKLSDQAIRLGLLENAHSNLNKCRQENEELAKCLKNSEEVRNTQRNYILFLDKRVEFLTEENQKMLKEMRLQIGHKEKKKEVAPTPASTRKNKKTERWLPV